MSRDWGWPALGCQPRSLEPLALPRRARPASCETLALRPLPPLPSLPSSLPSPPPPPPPPPPPAPAPAPRGPQPGRALTAGAGVPAAAVSLTGSSWGCGAPGAAMDQPLVASAEAEEELEWQVASCRRKAWAKCRGSWQASETEDLSTEATTQDEDEDDEEDLSGAKLPAAAGRGPCAPRGSGGRGARGSSGGRGKVSCALGDCCEFWKIVLGSGGRGERGHFRPLNVRAW